MILNTKNDKIMYHFWGTTSDDFFKEDRENYKYHGEYSRENIVDILSKNVDLVCLLTKCPETYCYTLSEVIYSSVPVLGIDLGAIGDRVRKYNAGWLVKNDISCEDIIKKIEEIMDNKEEYEKYKESIEKISLKTTKQMTIDTVKNYSKKESDSFDIEKIINENFVKRRNVKSMLSKMRFFKKG